MARGTFQKEIEFKCTWCEHISYYYVTLRCITNEPVYRGKPDYLKGYAGQGDEIYTHCPECGNLIVVHYKPDAYEVFMKKQMQRTRLLQRKGNPNNVYAEA